MLQRELLPEELRPGLLEIDRKLGSLDALRDEETIRLAEEMVDLYASDSVHLAEDSEET